MLEYVKNNKRAALIIAFWLVSRVFLSVKISSSEECQKVAGI